MLYPGLTGTRALSVPSTPLPFRTTAVPTGKGVIRRPQVWWYCLGAVRDTPPHFSQSARARDVPERLARHEPLLSFQLSSSQENVPLCSFFYFIFSPCILLFRTHVVPDPDLRSSQKWFHFTVTCSGSEKVY